MARPIRNFGAKALNGLFKQLDASFDRDDRNCAHEDTTVTDQCKLRVSVCFELNLPSKEPAFKAYAWDIDNPSASGTTAPDTFPNATFAAAMATKEMFMKNPSKVIQCTPQQAEQDINTVVSNLMAKKAYVPEFAVDFGALAEKVAAGIKAHA